MSGATLLTLALVAANPYLAQARNYFQSLEYEKCLPLLERAHSWTETSKSELAEIEMYSALCAIPLGQGKDARDRFALACRIDPSIALPPLTSPKVSALFDQACPKRSEVEVKPPELEVPPPPIPPPPIEPPPATTQPAPAPSSRTALKAGLIVASILGVAAGTTLLLLSRQSVARSMNPMEFFSDRVGAYNTANTQTVISMVAYGVGGAALIAAAIVFAVTW